MSKPMTNSKIQCSFNAEICRTVHTKLDNCSVVHTPAENWIMFAFHWDIHPPSNKISVVGIVLIRLTVYTTCTSSVHTMYIMFSYVWPTQLASTDTQLCHVPAYSVWLVWLWCMKMMFQQQTGATQTTIKYKVRWWTDHSNLSSMLWCSVCTVNCAIEIDTSKSRHQADWPVNDIEISTFALLNNFWVKSQVDFKMRRRKTFCTF